MTIKNNNRHTCTDYQENGLTGACYTFATQFFMGFGGLYKVKNRHLASTFGQNPCDLCSGKPLNQQETVTYIPRDYFVAKLCKMCTNWAVGLFLDLTYSECRF